MLFFCRRGQENLRELKADSFSIATDACGRKYVYQVRDELTKNRRENNEAEEGGFMYERQGVQSSLFKYLAHLNPRCDSFFQRPKKEAGCEEVWYDNQCVRTNTLSKKKKDISKQASLSREYTNHSIRATSVTLLDECGFEARHGHRSESSIRSYASKTSDKLKFAMSTGLSSALCNETGLNSVLCVELKVQLLISCFRRCKTLLILNLSVNIDSASRSHQFNFYSCSVNIMNKKTPTYKETL